MTHPLITDPNAEYKVHPFQGVEFTENGSVVVHMTATYTGDNNIPGKDRIFELHFSEKFTSLPFILLDGEKFFLPRKPEPYKHRMCILANQILQESLVRKYSYVVIPSTIVSRYNKETGDVLTFKMVRNDPTSLINPNEEPFKKLFVRICLQGEYRGTMHSRMSHQDFPDEEVLPGFKQMALTNLFSEIGKFRSQDMAIQEELDDLYYPTMGDYELKDILRLLRDELDVVPKRKIAMKPVYVVLAYYVLALFSLGAIYWILREFVQQNCDSFWWSLCPSSWILAGLFVFVSLFCGVRLLQEMYDNYSLDDIRKKIDS